MTVGKAKAVTPKDGDGEFRFVVPCFTDIDEARIRDHMKRDHFFWLDLHDPEPRGAGQAARDLRLPSARAGGHRALRPAPQARRLRRLRLPRLLRRVAPPGPRIRTRCARCTCSSAVNISSPSIATRCRRSTSSASSSTGVSCTASSSCSTASSMPSSTASSRCWRTWTTRSTSWKRRVLASPTDEQLQRLFALKRQLVAMRKVITPQRDLFAQLGRPDRRASRTRARRARLLPRHLRPPDPDQRPDRLLPRPALRRHRPVPLDGQQPSERRHEAAHGDRHDLPAARLHHRLLRPELRPSWSPT